MNVTTDENGDVVVRVRQSWLKDAIMCNERGRQAIVRGDWNIPNELTAFGTACHAAFEYHLTTDDDEFTSLQAVADRKFDEIANGEQFRWVKYQRHEIQPLMDEAIGDWMTGVRPQIEGDILGVEHNFEYVLDEFDYNGRHVKVVGTGTIDLITSTQLWDWKTASRKYRPKEKQEQDIQSTMYGGAAVAQGWATWPLTFNFGVLVRGGGSQIVPVERSLSHLNWLKRSIRPLVRQHLAIGLEEEWSMNDTGFLCNPTWCSYWSVCRGCHDR